MRKAAQKPVVRISSSQSAVRVPRRRITRLVAFFAGVQDVRIAEIDLAVVSSREIAALNRRWLGRRGATDVLSFDLSEDGGPGIAAQIVICGDIAAKQARVGGVQRELMLYVVHGLLHLMGYDDARPAAAAKMHAREQELLDAFRARSGRRR